ncbi:hypothetical protein JIN85_05780 [Luteolibacter pohnpeiensis]|uniref:Uncharacterized protein n=1 Tax=Luteolibacter pohnpeiensis TaxID=454153 RepID=A0A934VVW4_9BACT|nr:hypothetical protein [Luteolibacter pohnpeiensis]MBK1881914.1 hypothetical protein [Luteolibacter pohnpeiensis]
MKKKLLLSLLILIVLTAVCFEGVWISDSSTENEVALPKMEQMRSSEAHSGQRSHYHSVREATLPHIELDTAHPKENSTVELKNGRVADFQRAHAGNALMDLSSPIYVFYSSRIMSDGESPDQELLKQSISDVVSQQMKYGVVIDCDALTTSDFTFVVYSKPKFDLTNLIRDRYSTLVEMGPYPVENRPTQGSLTARDAERR